MNTWNQKEAKTKRGKKKEGKKTWRSKIKGGQEVKKKVETIYCNLPEYE